MKVRISAHAVDRYVERVKPALSHGAAFRDLQRLLALSPTAAEPPDWVAAADRHGGQYVLIADGIVACLCAGTVTTILTRASMGDEHRAARNAYKARKRKARRTRNRNWSQPRPRLEGDSWPT